MQRKSCWVLGQEGVTGASSSDDLTDQERKEQRTRMVCWEGATIPPHVCAPLCLQRSCHMPDKLLPCLIGVRGTKGCAATYARVLSL